MTRTLYEAAALVYGLVTLLALLAVAVWMDDRDAVMLMVLAIIAAYVCQVLAALTHILAHDGSQPSGLCITGSMVAWACSAFAAGFAVVLMVL